MEKLEAIVDDIVFQSDDGMFSVLRMESKAQGRFTAVYHGNAPYMGENVAMEGSWIEHARFGRQFDIQSLQVLQPTSVAGIERFLASGAVKGVGPVTAARIRNGNAGDFGKLSRASGTGTRHQRQKGCRYR